MNFFTKIIYFNILFIFSSQQVLADDIAVISLGREVTKIEIASNGSYKILEYIYKDMYEDLLEANIGVEGGVAKHEIVPWREIQASCKLPEKKEFLKTIDYLNPNLTLEKSLGELEKQIYKIKNQLGECGINNVLFNFMEESFVMSTESIARKQLKITSYMIDYSGRIRKIKINRTSNYQSNEFDIKSQHPRFNYTSEIENHSKKLFKE